MSTLLSLLLTLAAADEPAPVTDAPAPEAPPASAPAPAPEATPAPAGDPTPPARPRRGRPVPPGTPERYATQRPTPPYARWPADAPDAFASQEACRAWFDAHVPREGRHTIRRFDAVYRRCEPYADGWRYRETHAPLTLDPVLEPVLLAVPAAVVAAQLARNPDPAARGLSRWDLDCAGDDCDLRADGWTGPAAPNRAWRTYGDVMAGLSLGLTFSPLATSRGNAKLTDTIVMVEVALVNAAITTGLSLRSGEPRPAAFSDLRDWETDEVWAAHDGLRRRDTWLSNVNGHTSVVASTFFGLATLRAIHAEERRPLSLILPYVLASGLTALQGVSQVQSLRGDALDVTLGALTGVGVGVLVPLSHAAIARVIDPVRLERRREARTSRLTLTPTFGPNHLGLAGAW